MKPLIFALLPFFLIVYLAGPLETGVAVDNNYQRQIIISPKLASRQGTEKELANFINVRDEGVKGDGKSNDTAAIQLLLNNKKNIYFPDGLYLIDVERALNLSSNQTIYLSEQAILKALPSDQAKTAVLRLANVNNVHIKGGQIVGERYSHKGNSGEWGMGIEIIEGSYQITIGQMKITDCWGDGIYLGGSLGVSDILIEAVICGNNRRQGLSVTAGQRIMVKDSLFINTNGTLPAAGIDLEPNEGQRVEKIHLINVECANNNGSGLDLMAIAGPVQNVLVEDSRFIDNKGPGIRFFDVQGVVTLQNVEIKNNCKECPRQIERNNRQRFKQMVTMLYQELRN